jgi:hypothetical protein
MLAMMLTDLQRRIELGQSPPFPLPRLRDGLEEGDACRTLHPPLPPPASAGGEG